MLLGSRILMCGPERTSSPDGKSSGTYMFAGIGSIFAVSTYLNPYIVVYTSGVNPLESPQIALTVNPSKHKIIIIASIS
jgi:hypothetical protein